MKAQGPSLAMEPSTPWGNGFATQKIVGMSHRIQSIIRLIDQIRPSSVDVLIQGESGTGKELIAKALHFNSPRAKYPFVPINCAALPDNLVEAELFGIEKGVATGVDRRIGKFEAAHGGTLFLDEIGDLSPSAQAKFSGCYKSDPSTGSARAPRCRSTFESSPPPIAISNAP